MKNFFKKVVVFTMAMVLVLGFVACKGKDTPPVDETPEPPVITGVVNNTTYYLGKDVIKPAFDKGTGMLSRDSAEAVAFVSGTAVTELGNFVLTVSFEGVSSSVTFTVAEYFPEYEGQITDEFNNSRLSSAYVTDSSMDAAIEDGVAVFKNNDAGDPWGIVKRKFVAVNATEYPYIEFGIDKIGNGPNSRVEIAIDTKEYDSEEGSVKTMFLTADYGGVYTFDLLSWIQSKELNAQAQDLYLIIAVVGRDKGYAEARFDYVRSLTALPTLTAAERYNDMTLESLSGWREDSVSIDVTTGKALAYLSSPAPGEAYGKTVKRVNLNTKDYPYLVVDIVSVGGNASWAIKYKTDTVGETTIYEGKSTGRNQFELSALNGLNNKENIAVTLLFFVIGDGNDDMIEINGFETIAQSERAMPLNVDFESANGWVKGVAEGKVSLKAEDGKGIFYLTGDGYDDIRYSTSLNTIEEKYLVIDVESADCDHVIKVNDNPIYPSAKTTGLIYVNMQAVGSAFGASYNLLVSLNLFLIGSEGDEVVINSMYTTNVAPDLNLVDDFAVANWSQGTGTVTVADNTLTVAMGAGEMGKTDKAFTVDTSANSVVKFGIKSTNAGWDAGFKIKVQNRTTDGWPGFTVEGQDMVKVERSTSGEFDVYVDLAALAPEGKEEFFVGGAVTITFEIVVEYGSGKTIVFDSIRLVAEVPSAD